MIQVNTETLMLNSEVLNSLYDDIDILFATSRRVNTAALELWIKQRRIRTPLFNVVPGRPRLFWVGNVLEIELISLADIRGVDFEASRSSRKWDALSWIGRALALSDSSRLRLVWQDVASAPSLIETAEGTQLYDGIVQAAAKQLEGKNALIVIDLSQSVKAVEAVLLDRLQQRHTNKLRSYPTLQDKLNELRRSHDSDQKIAERIMSIA
jgi:hypothetical protein